MKIEDELREALRQAARTGSPSVDAWEQIENRQRNAEQPSRQRRVGVALVAAIIGLGSVALAVKSFQGGVRTPQKTPSVSPKPTGLVRTFDLGWGPTETSSGIAARDGYAWVAGTLTSTLIGPNEEQTPIPFDQGPSGLASSSTATWAVGAEPGMGNYVARFALGSPVPDLVVPMGGLRVYSVLATDTAVWIFGYARDGGDGSLGTMLRLDPMSGSVVIKLKLQDVLPLPNGTNPIVFASSADADGVWVLVVDLRNGTLGKHTFVRLDASTYQAQTYDSGLASKILAANGAVWLQGQHGPVRLDSVTGQSTLLAVPDEGALPFAATTNSVWFLGGSAQEVRLFRLDLVSGEPTRVGLEVDVTRQSGWGWVDAAYDSAGTVWLLYENGPLQEINVAP